MTGKTMDQMKIGDRASFGKTFGESDIYSFAGISGDFNPAHVNESFAQKTYFKTRIAHGMLTASLISTLVGTMLPGPGSIYVSQDLHFLFPVRIGDTITATAEVIEMDRDKNRVTLLTECFNQNGDKVLSGKAVASPPKEPVQI